VTDSQWQQNSSGYHEVFPCFFLDQLISLFLFFSERAFKSCSPCLKTFGFSLPPFPLFLSSPWRFLLFSPWNGSLRPWKASFPEKWLRPLFLYLFPRLRFFYDTVFFANVFFFSLLPVFVERQVHAPPPLLPNPLFLGVRNLFFSFLFFPGRP